MVSLLQKAIKLEKQLAELQKNPSAVLEMPPPSVIPSSVNEKEVMSTSYVILHS